MNKNEVVKYHNDFNKINLPSFTAQEQNILMGIISKMKDLQDEELITFYPQELKEFSDKNYTNNEILSVVRVLRDKFFKADFTILIEHETYIAEKIINLFKEFTIYKDKDTLNIDRVEMSVNKNFSYLLDNLVGNFTSFQLTEFLSLKSKYSKTLYRLLKQYKNTGKCLIYSQNFDGFRAFMDIPKSYLQADIDKKVLNICMAELCTERDLFNPNAKPIFENLTFKKIKDPQGRGRGGKVIGIEFYFTAEKERTTQYEQEKDLKALEKEMKKNLYEQEPQLNIFGEVVNELTPYIHKHFYMKNQYNNLDDTCKILDIQKTQNKIYVTAINQETNKTFNLTFDSLQHLKNALKLD